MSSTLQRPSTAESTPGTFPRTAATAGSLTSASLDPAFSTTTPTTSTTGMSGAHPTTASPTTMAAGPATSSLSAVPSLFPTNTGAPMTAGTSVSVLVTGASGTAGFEVLRMLCTPEYHQRFKVVAGIHRDHPPREVLDEVDVVRYIDADDANALDMTGCDILFIIPSNANNRVEQVANYVRAAVRDRVKFILLLSLVQPTSEAGKQSLFARQFQDMETLVSDSGIPCAFLRCSFFMQSLLSHYRELRDHNTLSLPIGLGTMAPVDVKDVARAACAILADPATHAFKAYDLMGPQVLSGDDLAAAASRALGRRITYRTCDPQEFLDVYRAHGVPEWLAKGFYEILDLHATGGMGSGEEVGFFMHLTGQEPTTVESFFRSCADVLTPYSGGNYEPAVSGRTIPRYRRESKGYQALDQGEELYRLLRELVTDKQRVLQAKYDVLYEEEANLDRLIDMFERWEHSASSASMAPRISSRSGAGTYRTPGRDDSAYIGGGDSDYDYEDYDLGAMPFEGHRRRKSGRGTRRRRSSYVVDY